MRVPLRAFLGLFAALLLAAIPSCGDDEPPPHAYSLADDVDRMVYVSQRSRVEFGTPRGLELYREADLRYHQDAKGWSSQLAGDHHVAYLLGGLGEFDLYVYTLDDCTLSLVGTALSENPSEAKVRVALDGQSLGETTFITPEGEQVGRATFDVPKALLREGLNRFTVSMDASLEVPLQFPFPVRASAVLLHAEIDGLEDGPRSVPTAEDVEGIPSIFQPLGSRLDFYHVPAAGEKFLVTVPKTDRAHRYSLDVFLGDRSVWSERGLTDASRDYAFDLTPHQGQICRIALRAGSLSSPREGEIEWHHPRISPFEPTSDPQPAPTSENNSSPPNILVVLLDALAADHVSCYGGRASVTPHIDRLADEGVRFEQALAPAPYTLPSIGSLFSSLHPDRHGIVLTRHDGGARTFDPSVSTLAEQLRETSSYRTDAIVTNPNAAGLYGYERGFDDYRELFRDPNLWDKGVRAEVTTERALEVIDTHWSDEHPSFLYVHYFPPHAPFTPPEEFLRTFVEPYDGVAVGQPDFMTTFADNGTPPLGEEDFKHLAQLYDANLAHVDREIGRLLDGLRQRGLYEDAVVLLCADHGEAFGQHRSLGHGHHLYRPTVRIPLIVKPPRSPGHKTIKTRSSLLDVAPTLLSLGGVDTASSSMEGRDLSPWIRGEAQEVGLRSLVLRSDLPKPKYALVRGPWKYIYDSLSRREELYHLERDPFEENDVAQENPDVARWARQILCRSLCAMKEDVRSVETTLSEEMMNSIQAIGYTGASAPDGSEDARCPLLFR